jgi:hypothetical protein
LYRGNLLAPQSFYAWKEISKNGASSKTFCYAALRYDATV